MKSGIIDKPIRD